MDPFANKAALEHVVPDRLRSLDYHTVNGPDIGPNGTAPERSSHKDAILVNRARPMGSTRP